MTDKDRNRTIWVKTVPETIDVLKNYKERLELVHLDHDLNGEHYVHPAREDCGTEIVRWLEKQDSTEYKDCQFVVHTWNLPAGDKMTRRLLAAGYKATFKPFGM